MNVADIRAQFPILATKVRGKPLVYLDNAATAQKPRAVFDAIQRYYGEENSNIHRGVHYLSELATKHFEGVRVTAQRFLNAAESREIVFVKGTTEAVNLVAQTFGKSKVGEGDEILITALEHHSNIVPWQMLAQEKKAKLRVAPIDDTGTVRLDEYEKLLTPRTKMVSISHVSNALGTVNPAKEMIAMAHRRAIPVMIDGAQAAPHMKVDVQSLDADFYAFSGHKIYGPTGIGVLYGKAKLLEEMPPYQGGGDMILSVTFEKTIYNKIPYKFEAGTPDIAGVVGLGAAMEWMTSVGIDAIEAHERDLMAHGTKVLSNVRGLRHIGTAAKKSGALSFVLEGVHPHDVGTILDQEGIAIRTGHHCAQPVMERFGIPGTVRASLAVYTTKSELDALAAALVKVSEVFA